MEVMLNSMYVSDANLKLSESAAEGSFVDLAGERYYRISHYDQMPPFFMSLVSDSDHWCFLSSNGALTAGRKDPDQALFPYYSDDRIHDSWDQTGSKTVLRIFREGKSYLWEPFSPRYEGLYRLERHLYKSVYGNRILFEEINHDLALSFRYAWMNSERFGFVRQATLVNHDPASVSLELLDGIQNVLPWGIERRFQLEYSTLADGYKRTELLEKSGLALFRLSSIPVDKAEPSEALRVNLAWSTGLKESEHLLCTEQLGRFRQGKALQPETDIRGRRGAYLLHSRLTLDAGAEKEWLLVAELGQDATQVLALQKFLESCPDLRSEVIADVARGTENLIRIVASADGLQATGDEASTWRHFSNTLFNLLRGGVPDKQYWISKTDFRDFLAQSNSIVLARHASFLEELPEELTRSEIKERTITQQDPDLERLTCEYLPLTFSRRHGDPSRPWNRFSIRIKDERGHRLLNYEGNWRDIFQNWEALGFSYPGFLESMIFKFLNASTADGYNPYHVRREGFAWEVVDPRDPWSFIGYWGDHQVIYLLKLLEASQHNHPGALGKRLNQQIFTFADLPYRIQPYEALLADPHHTISFDPEAHRLVLERARETGSDGLLLQGAQGVFRASLAEKLLVLALAKMFNYIPEAGIWMNTQRPEWNDANNALVGYGVSVVTLCYLRRYLAFCRNLFQESENQKLDLAEELVAALETVSSALVRHDPLTGRPCSDGERKSLLDVLGQAGSEYRKKIYDHGFSGWRIGVSVDKLVDFFHAALAHVEHSIRANRRPDGLYHAYNLMNLANEGIQVRHLYEMLEGQVGILSSGLLSHEEALNVLESLRTSKLYRADLGSYLLYPDRALPHFLEKNLISSEDLKRSMLLKTMMDKGDERIISRDLNGQYHFHANFRNASYLKAALKELQNGPYENLAESEAPLILDLYEQVFDHQSFTGRSGTFYKYEGLGCIYWHMVSKLLLAVDELRQDAGNPSMAIALEKHYEEIRVGLGLHKSPTQHGAIPLDPYSHTPSFAGAQQPGMTGQVKEDFLTRFSEMGLHVENGCMGFQPWRVRQADYLKRTTPFFYVDVSGQTHRLILDNDTLAFTYCQVPIVIHRWGAPRIQLTRADASIQVIEDLVLDTAISRTVFDRSGEIRRIDVFLEEERM